MKRVLSLLVVCSFVLLACGCQNTKSKAPEGTLIGGVLGAAAGAGIGSLSGNAGVGAGIGAAVGAISGGIIGSQIEKKPPQEPAAQLGAAVQDTSATQMSILQVIELSKQGTPDDVIIDRIKKSNSKFNLTSEDIDYLKKQGISQKVIDAMKGA